MSEYEKGFRAAKEIALAIAEHFISQFPQGAEDIFKKYLVEPLESMELKPKEQEQ